MHIQQSEIDSSAAGSHEDPEGYVRGAVMSDECWSVCASRDVRSAASQQARAQLHQGATETTFLFISGRKGSNFPLWRADRATFLYTMRKTNEASRDYLRSLWRGMWVRCQKLSVPLLVRVCEVMRHVCVNLSLTDAIFIILVYESRNHHITTDHRCKNKPLFWTWLPVNIFGENLFLFLFIVINYSKQHCSSHAGKSTCAFSSEYPFICSLYHASISQITCICSIIYLFH